MTLPFQTSPRSTVGIEWELQLIDRDSNDLRQAASAIVEAAKIDQVKQSLVHREMLLNTVEVISQPHSTIQECAADIQNTIDFLTPIADRLRIDFASAGTHPFSRPAYQRVTNSGRYAELVERTQYWGRQMLLYGLHVHVGIENRAKVLPIISAVLTRLAHVQSLSAASPFWAGVDTGYACNRAMVFQQLPTAGSPLQFETWEELEHYTGDMLHTGVIDSFDEIRWDIRPSPRFGTIEIRACDASTNIRELRALAALCHCLVEHFSTMLDEGKDLPSLPHWFVTENKWRSARYGMDAILILDRHGNEELVTDTVPTLITELEPTAQRLGCLEDLSWLEDILDLGASYQRQKDMAALCNGSLDVVVELMRAEMQAEHPLIPSAQTEIITRATNQNN